MKPAPITRTRRLSKRDSFLLDLWSSAVRFFNHSTQSSYPNFATLRLESLSDRLLLSVNWSLHPASLLLGNVDHFGSYVSNDGTDPSSVPTTPFSTSIVTISAAPKTTDGTIPIKTAPHVIVVVAHPIHAMRIESPPATLSSSDDGSQGDTTFSSITPKDILLSSDTVSELDSSVSNSSTSSVKRVFTPVPGHGTTSTQQQSPAPTTQSQSPAPTQAPAPEQTSASPTPTQNTAQVQSPTPTQIQNPTPTQLSDPSLSIQAPVSPSVQTSPTAPVTSTPATQTPVAPPTLSSPPIQTPASAPIQTPITTPVQTPITQQTQTPTSSAVQTPITQQVLSTPTQSGTASGPTAPAAAVEPKSATTVVVAAPSANQSAQRVDVQQVQAISPIKNLALTTSDDAARPAKTDTLSAIYFGPASDGVASADLAAASTPRETNSTNGLAASARLGYNESPILDSAALLAPQGATEIFAGDPLTDSSYLKLDGLDLPALVPELMPLLKADLALVPTFLTPDARRAPPATSSRPRDDASISTFTVGLGNTPSTPRSARVTTAAPTPNEDAPSAAKGIRMDRYPAAREPLSYPGWLLGDAVRAPAAPQKPSPAAPEVAGHGPSADEPEADEPSGDE